MFIDQADIYVKAGDGGDGAVSFRREKYIPNGGPDGGDGGDGGDIIIVVDGRCHGLGEFNRQKKYLAQKGQNGLGSNKSGKNGKDLVIKMPPGTQIFDDKEMIADLLQEGDQLVLVKGGRGGWGNQHFATSIKQAPKWSKKGERGQSKKLHLELKTIADIGLIGLPNAGKSTLLSVLSNAKPKIADYPFTTLEPNLGILKDEDYNIILADIPGLIEGASQGKGLGDKFLKHIERTKILLHVLSGLSEDPLGDYNVVRSELASFSEELTSKKEIVVLNKIDCINTEIIEEILDQLQKSGVKALPVSGATKTNLKELKQIIKHSLSKI